MKTWIILGAMILASHSALALNTTQACFNVTGEKLVIAENSSLTPASVQVDFTAQDVDHKLSGTWTYEDGYAMNPSQSGEAVVLKVSKIKAPGGRCGRCTPIGWDEYYAKLTMGSEVYNFTCEPPALP